MRKLIEKSEEWPMGRPGARAETGEKFPPHILHFLACRKETVEEREKGPQTRFFPVTASFQKTGGSPRAGERYDHPQKLEPLSPVLAPSPPCLRPEMGGDVHLPLLVDTARTHIGGGIETGVINNWVD
ncbi:hypothetical protein CABS01_12878 [Colletotrichum abscissum]|uniref:Uncharacterized protein n=1 Tax=Colletotrichum abscissum TaxID=1671311 RepID=A0A9Q0B3T4_9PEZI|nr:uncharacterized protein CABS01_12878 [Colletotrichum abscissum]KAI3550756.1 hypothetical protein CABS02_07555 [Colletotrichum abscissum]KAK1488003.1 hypothetical protein CABS01_12878 [Colletotrichum abscissum]